MVPFPIFTWRRQNSQASSSIKRLFNTNSSELAGFGVNPGFQVQGSRAHVAASNSQASSSRFSAPLRGVERMRLGFSLQLELLLKP